MARTDARDVSMRICYARLMGGDDMQASLEMMEEKTITAADEQYIQQTLEGVERESAALDAEIEKHLVGWTMERLARVDLCILRLAAYEILIREDVPDAVAVDEAVELARIYSTDKAPAFINGVLGSIARAKENK